MEDHQQRSDSKCYFNKDDGDNDDYTNHEEYDDGEEKEADLYSDDQREEKAAVGGEGIATEDENSRASNDPEDANMLRSLENMSFSPPQTSRSLKKEAATRHRNTKARAIAKRVVSNANNIHKTKPKNQSRPIFKNSAANLSQSGENESLTDSLTNMQAEHYMDKSDPLVDIIAAGEKKTFSAPATASATATASNNSLGFKFDLAHFNYWTDSPGNNLKR